MTGRKLWRMIAATAGLILMFGAAGPHAQQKTENEAVLAANQEFDKALSTRDIGAMGKAWAHEPYVVVVHPVSNAPLVGWEAVRKSWEQIFDRWAEISVSMKDPQMRLSGRRMGIWGRNRARKTEEWRGCPLHGLSDQRIREARRQVDNGPSHRFPSSECAGLLR